MSSNSLELRSEIRSPGTLELSLAEALQRDSMEAYGRQATGEKYLINPNRGL